MTHAQPLIERLDRMVAERSLLKHPFYQAWTAGQLPLERLRNYAIQYYRHVEAFPRYISAIHTQCEDLASRQALLENLIEEERGPENHPELWLRFAEGLGLARQQVLAGAPATATRELVETFGGLCRRSVNAGLAALYIYESQLPAVAAAKIEGLKSNYGIDEEQALKFFAVHEQADVWHARTGAELLNRHAQDASSEQDALSAAGDGLNALWRMLDSV